MPHWLRKPCAAARRHRQQIEQLEARRLLSAAPLVSAPPSAAWFSPEWPFTPGAGHGIMVYDAAVEHASPPATVATEPPPAAEVIFVTARHSHWANDSFAARFISQPPAEPAFTAGVMDHAELFRPSPTTVSANERLVAASLRLADARAISGGDFGQTVFLVSYSWQLNGFNTFTGPEGGFFDGRPHIADFLRAPPSDVRLAMSALDGLRSSNGALAYFDPDTDVERHATGTIAVTFGQSAEGETAAVGGRPMGGVPPGGDLSDDIEAELGSFDERSVKALVALEEALRDARADDSSAQAARSGGEQAASTLAQDVLAPRFAFDAAALTVAINDLAAQADELGVGLLEMLSPAASGETALVAGFMGAGLAYRHWRASSRDRRREEDDLLASRFMRGHASIRLRGGSS